MFLDGFRYKCLTKSYVLLRYSHKLLLGADSLFYFLLTSMKLSKLYQ